jgi:hypothetical protein
VISRCPSTTVSTKICRQEDLAYLIARGFGYDSACARHRCGTLGTLAQSIHPTERRIGIIKRDVIRDLDQVAFRTCRPSQFHFAFVR